MLRRCGPQAASNCSGNAPCESPPPESARRCARRPPSTPSALWRLHLSSHHIQNPDINLPFYEDRIWIRYFRNPCDWDPKQEISKTLNSSKIPQKYLTFTFGERAFTFGERAFTFGEIRDSRSVWVWNFFFCCSGGFGTLWVGGPIGVFENI